MRITTLIENNKDDTGKLFYEHGLSLFIETDNMQVLFDTGQSGDFIKNAKLLNKDLNNLDAVIISHGHYDHSGGFRKLVDDIKVMPKLIIGEEFFKPKFKIISQGEYKYNGSPFDEGFVNSNSIPILKISEEMQYIAEDMIVFHHFNKSNNFEKLNTSFLIKDGSNFIMDEFGDEISLGIITEHGLVVIVGCSHIGVVNILNTISQKIEMPIYAIIGGTHLVAADDIRIQKTIVAFKELDIKLLAVSHCTGENGIRQISQAFDGQFILNNTGNVIEI